MYVAKRETLANLAKAFGFVVDVVSSQNFEAHGEIRTRYTVKRPDGSKLYHAIMLQNGQILA